MRACDKDGEMAADKEDSQALEDLVDHEANPLTLNEIERIAEDQRVRHQYERRYPKSLYSHILLTLTHEKFSEQEAQELWKKIVAHLGVLTRILGRNVGISVASMDYLSNILKKIKGPVIIAEDKSDYVAASTTKDELTGLYSREVFDVVLARELEEAKRMKKPLCLLMIDIDDFKTVNDRFGHQVGDAVLRRIGLAIRDSIRDMDVAARYGGEEIVVIMPKASAKNAHRVAERLRKGVAALVFDRFSVTVSIGLGEAADETDTPEKLIAGADRALYAAKAQGKNCTVDLAELLAD